MHTLTPKHSWTSFEFYSAYVHQAVIGDEEKLVKFMNGSFGLYIEHESGGMSPNTRSVIVMFFQSKGILGYN